jgi:hypothetical protein
MTRIPGQKFGSIETLKDAVDHEVAERASKTPALIIPAAAQHEERRVQDQRQSNKEDARSRLSLSPPQQKPIDVDALVEQIRLALVQVIDTKMQTPAQTEAVRRATELLAAGGLNARASGWREKRAAGKTESAFNALHAQLSSGMADGETKTLTELEQVVRLEMLRAL